MMGRTQAIYAPETLDFVREVGLGVLDLVSLVEDAVRPATGLEPPLLGDERFIGRDEQVEGVMVAAKGVLDARALGGGAVEAQSPK